MLFYIWFYHVYRSALLRTIRLLLLFFLLTLLLTNTNNGFAFKIPLFFLSFFCMFELFFRYKVAHIAPDVSLANNSGDLSVSCTRELLQVSALQEKMDGILPNLLQYPQVIFLLQKANIEKKEVPLVALPKQDVLTYAASLAKTLNGTKITTMDMLAAYMLLIEQQQKLLFNKQVKQEEWLDILLWARHTFSQEESPVKKRVHFAGAGIGEALTTGWTLETQKYTSDFAYKAYKLKPHITGREKEYQLFIEGLSKKEKNNVLLVGNVGSGRENLVAYLVQQSLTSTVQAELNHIKVLELMIGPLIAGAANRAELESRLQAIIEEVSHSRNVVLYIPEFQNIIGSSSYNVDLSGALYPYLQSGNVPIIASVTVGNYKTYIEKNTLREVFNLVKLEEPDGRTAMLMLLQKAGEIEEKYQVLLTYKAIDVAVEYANRYFQDASLPGSAANLLEDVANKMGEDTQKTSLLHGKSTYTILPEHVISVIEQKTHIAVATPQGAEKELLLHLEEKLHERVISQGEAITAIAEAMRRVRSGLVSLKRPISFLFLGPTGVGKTETTKALASLYFGGEEKMIRLDMSEYADEEGVKRLLGAPPGEGAERGELTDKVTDNPFSIVLLDEFEKAYPKILDLFLQVLEDGRLTDNKGVTVSFINSIIIATSNAGAEFIRQEVQKGTALDKDFNHRLLDHLQTNHLFRPELINRFDAVIIFKPLGEPEMLQITKLLLDDVTKRLAEQDITFTYDEKLLTKVAKEGYDPQFGARPLRRYVQDNVEDILAQKKLRDEIKRGDRLLMTIDETNAIVVQHI